MAGAESKQRLKTEPEVSEEQVQKMIEFLNHNTTFRVVTSDEFDKLSNGVTPTQIFEKLDGIHGNVFSSEALLQKFYIETQKQVQSVADDGMRLEDIAQKAVEKGQINSQAKNGMLRSKLWSGLGDPLLKNTSRYKYDTVEKFDQLFKEIQSIKLDLPNYASGSENKIQHQPVVVEQSARSKTPESCTVVIENLSDDLSYVLVCPRVVNVKGSTCLVPVRILNMTAKAIVIKPKTHFALRMSLRLSVMLIFKVLKALLRNEKSISSDQELSSLGINLENFDVPDDTKLRLKGLVTEKSAERTGRRHKTRYDLKVRQSVLEPGDRVLLKNVAFRGKHKLENKWEVVFLVHECPRRRVDIVSPLNPLADEFYPGILNLDEVSRRSSSPQSSIEQSDGQRSSILGVSEFSNQVPVSSESETSSDNQASSVSDSHAPSALDYVQPESEIQVRRSSRQVKPPVRFQDYVRY
ncbi:Hypothetical predicted protein [Mytilus galloprovincialis]|uniref:Uncharacterized protein n=1 Tax=Mytilus galloprovincialis TaxID=29158 RepID=A0A8B6GRB9_MYTGA|nr:Hypothetical predicted protein [Mytilus galloprovincialis]